MFYCCGIKKYMTWNSLSISLHMIFHLHNVKGKVAGRGLSPLTLSHSQELFQVEEASIFTVMKGPF